MFVFSFFVIFYIVTLRNKNGRFKKYQRLATFMSPTFAGKEFDYIFILFSFFCVFKSYIHSYIHSLF